MTMQNSKLKNVKIVSRSETPKFCILIFAF